MTKLGSMARNLTELIANIDGKLTQKSGLQKFFKIRWLSNINVINRKYYVITLSEPSHR